MVELPFNDAIQIKNYTCATLILLVLDSLQN